jgi:hypothetical protein
MAVPQAAGARTWVKAWRCGETVGRRASRIRGPGERGDTPGWRAGPRRTRARSSGQGREEGPVDDTDNLAGRLPSPRDRARRARAGKHTPQLPGGGPLPRWVGARAGGARRLGARRPVWAPSAEAGRPDPRSPASVRSAQYLGGDARYVRGGEAVAGRGDRTSVDSRHPPLIVRSESANFDNRQAAARRTASANAPTNLTRRTTAASSRTWPMSCPPRTGYASGPGTASPP